ncbi:hypothetical protein SAMN05421858_4454 [Haladaptatus litoreus]|uniref:Uncharacterized protein n=2 Tax=Haladaptatus litoreus TaxID=553468 RepID=A0A1N7ENZ4_9EURY|nr:hypothetical protein SAMN05421858_4454 [Haladaptatus litoreus]
MSGESKWDLGLPSRTKFTDVHDGLSATTPVVTDGMLLVSSTQHDILPEWYESIGYVRYETLYRIEATETSNNDDSQDDDSDGDNSNKDESSEDRSDTDESDTGSEDSGEEEQYDDTENDC